MPPDIPALFSATGGARAEALLLGLRLDTRELERWPRHRVGMLPRGAGVAIVFPFGAAVLIGIGERERAEVLAELAPRVRGAFDEVEREEAEILLDPSASRVVDPRGRILLTEATAERVTAVAAVLAKSVVLARYEERTEASLERAERLAEELRGGGRIRVRARDLLREIGDALVAQSRTVGRAEVAEKLELTWDLPDVDAFYERLALEYELEERDRVLTRKLALIDRTAGVALELVRTRQSLRVEWYIVILIVVEVVLLVIDMAT